MIYYIYKIVNTVNQKVYIGFTNRPEIRWKNHLKAAFKNNIERPLYRSMRKYGSQAFEMEIIWCSKDRDYTLKTMEPCFIADYHSKDPQYGYNLTLGGESNAGWNPTNETRRKMSKAREGIVVSEETRQKHRLNMIKNSPMKNPESRRKLSETLKRLGIRPILTPEMIMQMAENRKGKPIHTKERKQHLSGLFKANNPMHNPEQKERARQNKLGKGTGEKNGKAVFAQIFKPDGSMLDQGFLRSLCEKHELPYKTFLENARNGLTPMQRRHWKGWNVVKIPRPLP